MYYNNVMLQKYHHNVMLHKYHNVMLQNKIPQCHVIKKYHIVMLQKCYPQWQYHSTMNTSPYQCHVTALWWLSTISMQSFHDITIQHFDNTTMLRQFNHNVMIQHCSNETKFKTLPPKWNAARLISIPCQTKLVTMSCYIIPCQNNVTITSS